SSLRSSADNSLAREALSEVLWDRARLLDSHGQGTEAANFDKERKTVWQERAPAELIDLATREAARANVIGYGNKPLPEGGERVRQLDRDQAASTLQLALARGF